MDRWVIGQLEKTGECCQMVLVDQSDGLSARLEEPRPLGNR